MEYRERCEEELKDRGHGGAKACSVAGLTHRRKASTPSPIECGRKPGEEPESRGELPYRKKARGLTRAFMQVRSMD